VTEHRVDGDVLQIAEHLQIVTPRPGRDVEQADGFAVRVNLLNGFAKQLLEVGFSDADASPADAVEITAIHDAAQRRPALSLVFVDVIQGSTGIEAGAPAELDSFAQASERLHR